LDSSLFRARDRDVSEHHRPPRLNYARTFLRQAAYRFQSTLKDNDDVAPENLARLARLTRESIVNALRIHYEQNRIYVRFFSRPA
jgi:myosin heavy subunit